MEFFIKKNATLPILKMRAVNDGRASIQEFTEFLEVSSIYFTMVNVETGIPKITSAPAYIVPLKLPEGATPEYYVCYNFKPRNVNKVGRYQGSFLIKHGTDNLILPIREELFINIQESITDEPIPNLYGFKVPPKFLTDPPFKITPPISNSPGPFTYVSANNSIVEMNGDIVVINGIGETTITAIQQPADGFGSATITAISIVVLDPTPSNTRTPAKTPTKTPTNTPTNTQTPTQTPTTTTPPLDFTLDYACNPDGTPSGINCLANGGTGIYFFGTQVFTDQTSAENNTSWFPEGNNRAYGMGGNPNGTYWIALKDSNNNKKVKSVDISCGTTPTPTLTNTETPTQTPTNTTTQTPTNTATQTPTNTATQTETLTPTTTQTQTPTNTATQTETPTQTPTNTTTQTPTNTTTQTETQTPTPTNTTTQTPTPTNTATQTQTPTNTTTQTPTSTYYPPEIRYFSACCYPNDTFMIYSIPYGISTGVTIGNTYYISGTGSFDGCATNIAQTSVSQTYLYDVSTSYISGQTDCFDNLCINVAPPCPTHTPTTTQTPTNTNTPTNTTTSTTTQTPTNTSTQTPSNTTTQTPTNTTTQTQTPTNTTTQTQTPTNTATPTKTPTQTPTVTKTPTNTTTQTPTVTKTNTPSGNIGQARFRDCCTAGLIRISQVPSSVGLTLNNWYYVKTPGYTGCTEYYSFSAGSGTIYTYASSNISVGYPNCAACQSANSIPCPTQTPTTTPTPTPTITQTPSLTAKETPLPTQTPTTTQTPTNTTTITQTPTQTQTSTNTETPTQTPTNTNTQTSSETPTQTPTNTMTQTPTNTQTSSETPTQTPTNTMTQTPTNTETPTQTLTQTPTNTETPTQTQTPTNTETPTQTQTSTNTETQTPTNTETPTQTPTNTTTQTPSSTQVIINNNFIFGSGFNSQTGEIVVDSSSNKTYVTGSFLTYQSQSWGKLVRLNNNGGADITLNIGTGFTLNSGINNITILNDTNLMVYGSFTSYSGITTKKIIRISSGGTYDNTFIAGNLTDQATFGSAIYSLVVMDDGNYLISGIFSAYSGISANNIISIDTYGFKNNSFNYGFGFSGGFPNTSVNQLVKQPDGKIIVGGFFTNYNGTNVNNIVRLNIDGTIDNTFNIGTGLNSSVSEIIIQPDGKILVGGSFTTYNSQTARRIVRLNSDGTIDNTFSTGTGSNGNIFGMALSPTGKIYLGGSFTSFNGLTSIRIVKLNSDGSVDSSKNFGTGFNNSVSDIGIIDGGNNIVCTGPFTSFNGTSCNYIISLTA